MISRLIELCARRRHIAWGIAILLAIYGYISYTKMTIEAYPELSDVSVQVATQVPGLSAEDIEKQITIPLERALINVPDLFIIRSSSTFALSLITLVFNPGAEDYFSRERVLNHVNDAILPNGIKPSLSPLTGSGGEIYRSTLESSTNKSIPVLVRDLGQLRFGHQEREGILGKNQNPDSIEGIVQMRKYQNPSHILEGVHAKINQLQHMLDPMDVKIIPYIDRDDLVKLTIDKVTRTVIEGI